MIAQEIYNSVIILIAIIIGLDALLYAALQFKLFRRKRYRWVQRITGIHRVHHPRWSFGHTLPLTTWVYFVEHGWRKVARDSYHDSTALNIY